MSNLGRGLGKERLERPRQTQPLIKIGPASKLIVHPTRVAVIGRAQMGKTTMSVELILNRFGDMDRYFALCPSFHSQNTYDPIRHLFRKNDVFERPSVATFERVLAEIKSFQQFAQQKQLPKPKVFILLDDVTGLSISHGNGKGVFGNFATRVSHENTSLFIITHDGVRIDPNFRTSAENVIVYPSCGEKSVRWLIDEYSSPILFKGMDFKKAVVAAWEGKEGRKGIGKHFLFIHHAPRELPRFFSDFDNEIKVEEE